MLQLYENIKKFRTEKHMSQEELAEKVGYKSGKSMISRIENGQIDLGQTKIMEFAEALGVSPGELMGRVERQEPNHNDRQLTAPISFHDSSNYDLGKETTYYIDNLGFLEDASKGSDFDMIIKKTSQMSASDLRRLKTYLESLLALRSDT